METGGNSDAKDDSKTQNSTAKVETSENEVTTSHPESSAGNGGKKCNEANQNGDVLETNGALTIKQEKVESVDPDEPIEEKAEGESKDETDKAKAANDEAEWEKNVLLVSGMPPGEAGKLKQLLNTTLGVDCHRIKPRLRGDTKMYVLFKSHDQMKVAESLLHYQKFLKYHLTAKVVDGPLPKKRPVPREKKDGEPPSKKQKSEVPGQQFLEGKYDDQIAFKTEDVQTKLLKVAKLLQRSYPKYGGLIFRREVKNNGFICVLSEFKKCPENECWATRCKFTIGVDEETKEPELGIRVGKQAADEEAGTPETIIVKNISKVNHNYPQHVIDAAKVFEKFVLSSDKVPGKCKFWHELIIRTNSAQELMMMVFVYCKPDSGGDELKELNEKLKEFFESGEGKEIRLGSLYSKDISTDASKPNQHGVMELVVGTSYLEETVMGFQLRLLPMMYFWNSLHAAKMVCEGVEELLAPKKKISILEIGCGIGLIGFYMSKLAGEVLSVDVDHLVEEAKKNAERNDIQDIEHFAGKAEEVIPEMAKKITNERACAIVISSVNRYSTCPKAMEELRKVKQLKRIVLVTEMSTSRFSPIVSLARTSTENGLGNPFFPVRAIPVDTMPHSKSYVLLVLLERIDISSIRKSKQTVGGRLRDAKFGLASRRFDKPFGRIDDRRQEGRNWGYSKPNMYGPMGGYEGQRSSYINAYYLQQLLEEERRRRMEVEEERRWLEREHRRRQMEEKKKSNPVSDLINDSLKQAGVPDINPDAAQKLKQVIAEAIKAVGVLGSDSGPSNLSGGGGYGGGGWEQSKPGPQPLLGMKLQNQPPPPPPEPYNRMYQSNYGYGQHDGAGAKPYYATQDSGFGRPNTLSRGNVQYPMGSASQYGGGYSGSSYSSFESSGSQRGGYRNSSLGGSKRYF